MNIAPKLLRLLLGLFLCALGVTFSINANLGLTPWDVFHQGVAASLGTSYGAVATITGLVILGIAVLLKEPIGIGTIIATTLIGPLVDIIGTLNFFHIATTMPQAFLMLGLNLICVALGTYLILSSGLGAGSRDSLMTAIAKRTPKLPVAVLRSGIEGCSLLVGWLCGGQVGIGTLISVIAIGPLLNLTFTVFGFELHTVEHASLKDAVLKKLQHGKRRDYL